MNVNLLAHTTLSTYAISTLIDAMETVPNQRAAVALTAIRTCYSPLKPTEILPAEGAKYFGSAASDGGDGTDADRLFRHIVRSGHASTLEHCTYTFAIEGVSRALLAQLTRHRQFSFSVQSQRYVKFGSGDKSGGFDYVTPPSVSAPAERVRWFDDEGQPCSDTASGCYEEAMQTLQDVYDRLRSAGISAEDARFVLPNAAACNLVMTGNLRAILEFYGKRRSGNGAQWEIAELSERIREEVTKVDGWVARFFDGTEAHE